MYQHVYEIKLKRQQATHQLLMAMPNKQPDVEMLGVRVINLGN